MLQADAEGIHLFCHCFGDGASRMFLDAVELAVAENPAWDRRHSTSHSNLIHADDVSRYAELGVIADFQMAWGASSTAGAESPNGFPSHGHSRIRTMTCGQRP